MQAYKIAMFLLAVNWMFALFSAGTPLFGSLFETPVNVVEGVYTYEIKAPPANESLVPGYDESLVQNSTAGFTDYQPTDVTGPGLIEGILMVFTAFMHATALLPFFLNQLGVPGSINVMVTGGCWLVYGFGIVQFVRGVGSKTME